MVTGLIGCQTTRASAPRTLHAYEGDMRPTNELVHVKVLAPIKVSFVDDVYVRVVGGQILALLPGTHTLIAGRPTRQRTSDALADRIATGLSENREIPINGQAGDLFTLGSDANEGLSSMSLTVNGATIPMPKIYRAELVSITNRSDAATFFDGITTSTFVRVHRAFLDDPDNARDCHELQGRWRVTAITMENGKQLTASEFKRLAGANSGDTALLDMTLEVKGVRTKWTGKKVRGESVIVDLDSHRTPKVMRERSVGNSDDQMVGIYELQGDTLRYCFGARRPASFTTSLQAGRLSFVLQREPQTPRTTAGGQ